MIDKALEMLEAWCRLHLPHSFVTVRSYPGSEPGRTDYILTLFYRKQNKGGEVQEKRASVSFVYDAKYAEQMMNKKEYREYLGLFHANQLIQAVDKDLAT